MAAFLEANELSKKFEEPKADTSIYKTVQFVMNHFYHDVKRMNTLIFCLFWFRNKKLGGQRIIWLNVLDAPIWIWCMTIENTASIVECSTYCHRKAHNFAQETLFVINHTISLVLLRLTFWINSVKLDSGWRNTTCPAVPVLPCWAKPGQAEIVQLVKVTTVESRQVQVSILAREANLTPVTLKLATA